MTPADPLTPEEVERLPSETRFLYRQAEKLKGRLLAEGQPGYGAIGVGCDWLISHITRAARMEAFIEAARHVFGPRSSKEVPAMPNEAALREFMRTYIDDFSDRWDECERLFSALAPTERSK